MGFKTEQFVGKVDENLKCSICLEVLEDPWQCKDGHSFCKDCITRCLEARQICPVGNNALQLDSLARSLVAKNMIQNLEVYCHPPESDGQTAAKEDPEKIQFKCVWTGKLQSLAKHRETCPFQQVECPNVNCNTNMQRRELEDHDKICEYKEVICQKCRTVMVRLELPVHKDVDCPEEMVPCPNSCTSPVTRQMNKMKRMDLDEHLINDCAKTILDCPFKDQGCTVQVERQHVDKHVQDNMAAHMMLLAKQCSSLTKQNSSLTEQNTTLTEQCSTLTRTCSTLTEQNTVVTEHTRSLAKENKQLKEKLNEVKKDDELSRTYRWKIENYRNLRWYSSIRSPTFWLCGYSWYLKIFPVNKLVSVHLCLDEGCGSSPRDDITTLCRNKDISVLCRLTVPNFRSDTEDISSEKRHVFRLSSDDRQLKWDGFMTANDAISTCCMDGDLIMKCTIQVDYEHQDCMEKMLEYFKIFKDLDIKECEMPKLQISIAHFFSS